MTREQFLANGGLTERHRAQLREAAKKRVFPPLETRFWANVDMQGKNDCWLWTGARLNSGYGEISDKGKALLAHRVSFAITNKAAIPRGMDVLHDPVNCKHKHCVNPSHLRLGTDADNAADTKISGNNFQLNKTACPQGHSAYRRKADGARYCVECAKARAAVYQKKNSKRLTEAAKFRKRRWREANREACRAKARAYKDRNREEYLAKAREYARGYRQRKLEAANA